MSEANTFKSMSANFKEAYGKKCKQCGKQFEIRAPKQTSLNKLSDEASKIPTPKPPKFGKLRSSLKI